MRRSMRYSILALLGLATVALSGGPAFADSWKREHVRGDRNGVRTVVIERTDRGRHHGWRKGHGRHHGWRQRHRGHGRTVVVVKRPQPVTRVIVKEVRPRHHRHDDPLARLLGHVLAGAFANTLETGRSGRTVAWTNPDSGATSSVTPIRTYRSASGQYCREYQTTGSIGGYDEDLYGTACRQPDGSWIRVQ